MPRRRQPAATLPCADLKATLHGLESQFRYQLHDIPITLRVAADRCAYADDSGITLIIDAGDGTVATRWLLAHEIAHVLQLRAGRVTDDAKCVDNVDALEAQASWVADVVQSGATLPAQFHFLPARRGLRLFHLGPGCPGQPVDAGDAAIWGPANKAIEDAYLADPAIRGHADAVFFGSQFENRTVLLPKGAPNKAFGNLLLQELRGIRNQYRPDIIDFHNRVFYEIKTRVDGKARGQIASYYRVTEEIRQQHASFREPPWKVEYATWYPAHMLPFPPDPVRMLVCTEATNHNTAPGLIIYDVRRRTRRDDEERREQPVSRYELVSNSDAFADWLPRIRQEMGRRIRRFDPSNPEYVVIAPRLVFESILAPWNESRMRKMQVNAPFLDKRNPIGRFHDIGLKMLLVVAGAEAALGAVTVIAYAGASVAVAETVAVGEAAAATSTATAASSGAIEVIEIGQATAAATGAGAGAAGVATVGAGGLSAAAIQAIMASSVVKGVTVAAGSAAVLLVTFSSSPASAGTGAMPRLQVNNVYAIRIVPAKDFSSDTVPAARTVRSALTFETCLDSKAVVRRFQPGAAVTYDGQPHNVIALVTVK